MRLSDLEKDLKQVIEKPGIYRIFWKDGEMPEFRTDICGGTRNDPVKDLKKLEDKWVDGECCIYIGKVEYGKRRRTLRIRISELIKYGRRSGNNHRGGRYMWQIRDIWDHVTIEWEKCEECENPKEKEKKLLADFKKKYGKLPFANLIG